MGRTDHFSSYELGYDAKLDRALQAQLEATDSSLRFKFDMPVAQTSVGLLDLVGLRLAMLHPDRLVYAASVPKIAVLLAYFELNAGSLQNLDPEKTHALGLMIKASSNEMASRFSRDIGLKEIQRVLDAHGFYEVSRGGGIWMGKHYGQNEERIGDPVGDHSHAATVRQLLRFYLLLEQRKLVSANASEIMRRIFESPGIPHDNIKFVAGLRGRDVQLIRKWGSWEDWLHDTAVVRGPGRHYILVALTRHARGDEYLAALAQNVDDLLSPEHPR